MISYGRQSINNKDIRAVKKVLNSDNLTIGPLVQTFESCITSVVQVPCFVVSSGTAALHCAYAAIGLEPGDEVITSPNTFVATAATAMQFGAKIVFCDIEPSTGNMDVTLVRELITNKTKAIAVVDFAGHPADLLSFRKIADEFGIFLIEDAAHSFGSKYLGINVGSMADLTTFSFFPTKNITTAEGGAVASNNPVLLDRAKKFGRQGLVREKEHFKNNIDGPWHQEVHSVGLNYRMPDVLCALGISQIQRLNRFQLERERIFNYYSESLKNISSIELPITKEYAKPFWHLYPIKVKKGMRNLLHSYLADKKVFAQVNYVPVYFHPVFKELGYSKGICPNAEIFYTEELSLPIYPGLTKLKLKYIVSLIHKFFDGSPG